MDDVAPHVIYEFEGFELDRMGALVALSMAFLGYVVVNGLFKLYINTYKGRLGEGMLRRLRAQLLGRILRFPLPQFRKLSQGELIAMVTGEVEAASNAGTGFFRPAPPAEGRLGVLH